VRTITCERLVCKGSSSRCLGTLGRMASVLAVLREVALAVDFRVEALPLPAWPLGVAVLPDFLVMSVSG
jgi:hypothetical protein